MKTYIYIDGFNFYYLAVKNTPYKWLDFKTLFAKLLTQDHSIVANKYFTAIVSGTPDDLQKPIRQETYIRALENFIPEFSAYYGHFMKHKVMMPLANPNLSKKFELVIKTEEKGSDVNLAVHLLNDAWSNKFECAVVVSNDSDLAEAMRLVKVLGKSIGLITPGKGHPSKELMQYADFIKRIREGVLKNSQLPDSIPGTNIRKPVEW